MSVDSSIFHGIADLEELKEVFDATIKNRHEPKYQSFRKFLLELLFEIRENCLSIADGRAYILTCLYLSKPLSTLETVQDLMTVNPILFIALAYRDRVTFDAFRAKPESEEFGILPEEKIKLSAYWSKFRGKEKLTIAALSKWLREVKGVLYLYLKKRYLAWQAQKRNRTFASVHDDQKDKHCYICEYNMSSYSIEERLAYSFSLKEPIYGAIGGDKSSVIEPTLLCGYCIASLRLSMQSPETIKQQQIRSRIYTSIRRSI